MTKDDARREVRRQVDASWSRSAFADKAHVSVKTLDDFLNGRRWPHGPTLGKIEKALGWPIGQITDLAEGATRVPTPTPAAQDYTAQIIELIRAHPGLHPVNKAHLAKQVEILAMVPVDADLQPHEQVEDVRPELRRRLAAATEPEKVSPGKPVRKTAAKRPK